MEKYLSDFEDKYQIGANSSSILRESTLRIIMLDFLGLGHGRSEPFYTTKYRELLDGIVPATVEDYLDQYANNNLKDRYGISVIEFFSMTEQDIEILLRHNEKTTRAESEKLKELEKK